MAVARRRTGLGLDAAVPAPEPGEGAAGAVPGSDLIRTATADRCRHVGQAVNCHWLFLLASMLETGALLKRALIRYRNAAECRQKCGCEAPERSRRGPRSWWLTRFRPCSRRVSGPGAPADQPLLRRNERRFLAGP
jgi:hypothetical protein